MGMPIGELRTEPVEGRPGLYLVTKVPKPHASIETVLVQAFPETGVCFVKGVSADLEDDQHGAKGRGLASDLAGQLESKYGAGQKIDRCLTEYGCDSDYWTMKLHESGRVYMHRWEAKEDTPLQDGIKMLGVIVNARNILTTYISVEYYFSNEARCEELEKQAQASSL